MCIKCFSQFSMVIYEKPNADGRFKNVTIIPQWACSVKIDQLQMQSIQVFMVLFLQFICHLVPESSEMFSNGMKVK